MSVDAQKLAELYKSVVEDKLGLLGKIDDDNDVTFRHPDMGTMFFSLDAENDPEYFMLVYTSFLGQNDVTPPMSRERLLDLVNEVNCKNKAVKLSVRKTNDPNGEYRVTATIEGFVAGPNQAPQKELLEATIERSFNALRSGAVSVVKLAQEASNASGASGDATI